MLGNRAREPFPRPRPTEPRRPKARAFRPGTHAYQPPAMIFWLKRGFQRAGIECAGHCGKLLRHHGHYLTQRARAPQVWGLRSPRGPFEGRRPRGYSLKQPPDAFRIDLYGVGCFCWFGFKIDFKKSVFFLIILIDQQFFMY